MILKVDAVEPAPCVGHDVEPLAHRLTPTLVDCQDNDTFGEFVITPALMMGMDDIILDRISFGGFGETSSPVTMAWAYARQACTSSRVKSG